MLGLFTRLFGWLVKTGTDVGRLLSVYLDTPPLQKFPEELALPLQNDLAWLYARLSGRGLLKLEESSGALFLGT